MAGQGSQGRRARAFLLKSGATALALLVHQQAWAACAPDPVQSGQTTTCSGLDADGFVISTSDSTVVVTNGAVVTGSGGAAISVAMPSPGNYFTRTATLNIDGIVAGGANAGIQIEPGSLAGNSFDGGGSSVRITIGATGLVSGSAGISGVKTQDNPYAGTVIALDNSGTVSANSGPAIAAENLGPTFSTIVNRQGALIRGIATSFDTLDNSGTIDGGSGSAVAPSSAYGYRPNEVRNAGLITSAGAAPTIMAGGFITNSGAISNTGSGNAISASTSYLIMSNEAGGSIAANGTAISAPYALSLTNAGLITGNVVAGSNVSFTGSRVDTGAGVLDGNLQFGDSFDTLYVRYANGASRTGVTGTIDGAGGTDTVIARFLADATVTAAAPSVTGFESFGVEVATDTRVVLADGFSMPTTLLISGAGTIENRTALAAAGTVVDNYWLGDNPNFVNAGTIEDTRTSSTDGFGYGYAVRGTLRSFENTGRILSSENGVSVYTNSFINSGDIIAAGTAVYDSLNGLPFRNSGLIRSTSGTGLSASSSSYNVGYGIENSGTIEGVTTGADLGTNLINTGTIRSSGTGVRLAYGTLENRSGGLIAGDEQAATVGYTGTLVNSGTINGNVTLQDGFGYGNARFFALDGSVLNGNLTLGNGTTFVTELTGAGTSGFAGVNGSVTSAGGSVRFRVRDDASPAIPSVNEFTSVGYDLYDGSALTLSGNGDVTQQLVFAGNGSVDLTANLVATSQPAILSDYVLDWTGNSYAANTLSIVSRGAITLTRSNPNTYPSAVQLREGDVFTNAGTITMRDVSGSPYQGSAISGGKVVNTGTITVENAQALNGSQSVDNSGSITGNGPLARYLPGTLTNSGTLTSINGPALQLSSSGLIDNLAGGVISGAGGIAIQSASGSIRNAGTINGSVDLSYLNVYSYYGSTYTAAGGTLNGDLRFGRNDDLLIETGSGFGVTGTIDGGEGYDLALHARSGSGTVELGTLPTGFEGEGVTASGAGTVVTITGAAGRTADIAVGGDAQIVNRAATTGSVRGLADLGVYLPDQSYNTYLASFDNQADVGRTIAVRANALTNTANVGLAAIDGDDDERGIEQYATGALSFNNSGTVASPIDGAAADLIGEQVTTASIVNSGTLDGGLSAVLLFTQDGQNPAVTLDNSGTIKSAGMGDTAAGLYQSFYVPGTLPGPVTIAVNNTGTIEQTGTAGDALYLGFVSDNATTIRNAGTIRANAGGITGRYNYPYGWYFPEYSYLYTDLATGIHVSSPGLAYGYEVAPQVTISNLKGATIEATGALSVAALVEGKLTLDNAGTINGGGDVNYTYSYTYGPTYSFTYAGAIQTLGDFDDSIVNSGTITGTVDLGGGNDTIVNTGTMTGNVRLGSGDDAFTQRISATLGGTISGGEGFDTFRVDATGTGAIAGSQIDGFERLVQTGPGSAAWSGRFEAPTIELDGSTLLVAAGSTLQTSGMVAVTGGNGAEVVTNAGTIAGSVVLGDGNDLYRDLAGSTVAGTVDGGSGQDTYEYVLAGDRNASGTRANFETLAVGGSGTLTYALEQSFAQARLDGVGLTVSSHGYTIGEVLGGAGSETLRIDGDLARVALAGGNDTLVLGTAVAAGNYDGGTGTDTLTFSGTAPVTLAGTVTGFEALSLDSNALTVAGTLGTAGETVSLTDRAEVVTLAQDGAIRASLNLGAGDDRFRLQQAGYAGPIDGGLGEDTFSLETGAPYTISDAVTGFERFALGGNALTIAGTLGSAGQALRFEDTDDTITVAAGGRLLGNVSLGGGNDRLTIVGAFAGSVDGGAGTDVLSVSGGSQSTPVAFASIAQFESYAQSGGFATISGTAALGTANLTGGRLVGLAGSTINAGTINVQQGAIFGSAGTVNANIAVAGTLSPGASPGTMTVNGNVSLGATSVSLFEITPTVADQLVISGTLSIAQGATLQLAPSADVQAGRSLDLIVAGGGISGSFTNIVKPASLFGVVVQGPNRIQLLGQFLNSPNYTPQVQASVAYTNAILLTQPAGSPLLTVLPALAPSGVTDAAAFARLTPEPYASAVQASVERGLIVTRAMRSMSFAQADDTPRAFTFGQALGGWSRIDAGNERGTARVKGDGYGFLGGIGFAASNWAVGGFVGYLKQDQTIAALAARTKTDGVLAGVHLRYDSGSVSASASAFYDGADAETKRSLPAVGSADSDYNLRGWGFDAKVAARVEPVIGLAMTPQIGTTWIRTRRSGTVESGGSPFALTVAGDRQWAGFADASLKFETIDAHKPLRPWVMLGARYQLQGRSPLAVAGFGGGASGLVAYGVSRARLTGTVDVGLDATVSPGVDLFVNGTSEASGHGSRTGANAGIKVSF
ncbi:autotransporter outer membrane beta-barrel domain-containing protein [Novosphingobium sp. 9U]|uniref:autotransporter outer membrane beta-barrel domain-containing protein n=1 Tax=Novosphingobium sp. 9U TaxID=2653158 RepID=UPI0012EF615C|nr:autotransporter outer membrane beta-barrel domain-containing protein [Novosphingobium sp. 9U]VWX48763.1 conserved exported hypothetical protein [Novosphingobium sp. 9U]